MPKTEPTSAPHASTATPSSGFFGYLRNTLRHGSVYLLGVVLYRLVSFLMLPIYTRVLSPEDYGVLELLSLSTDIVTMLAGLGIGMAVTRYFYFYADESDRAAVISSAAVLMLGMFAAVAAVGVAFAGPLARLLLGPGQPESLVVYAVVGLALGSTIEVPLVVLRARQRSSSALVVGLARLLLAVGLNIIFVVYLRLGVHGVLYSTILSSLLVGGYLTVRLFIESGIQLRAPILRQLISYGAPLVVWNIASFVLHFSDRYFLRAASNLEAVGLYSLGYKLAMMVSLLVMTPFSDIWTPKALEIERREGSEAVPILVGILEFYNLVLVAIALLVALFAEDVVRIVMGESFHSASAPIPLLCVAMVLFGFRCVTQIGAMIRERSDLVAWSTAAAAACALAFNATLIPQFGIWGAATATVAAFAVEFMLMRRLSESVYPLRIPLGKLLLPLGLGIVTWTAVRVALPQAAGFALGVTVKTLGVFGFAGLLFLTGGIGPLQRQAVSQILEQRLKLTRRIRSA